MVDNIEDLVLDDGSISIPEEISYEFIKDRIIDLQEKLDAETKDAFPIKSALREMHAILIKHPTMVHEMLPEDIGTLSQALMTITDKYITTVESKKRTKKVGTKISKAKFQQIVEEGADDF